MAISNELSSEIAAAMLVEKKSPQELKRLSEIVLQVHSALQKMSQHAAAERMKAKAKKTTSADYTDYTARLWPQPKQSTEGATEGSQGQARSAQPLDNKSQGIGALKER